MTPCARPDVADLLGSYVLGACSEAEAATVRGHAARCAFCSEVLVALAPAREGLLADVAQTTPPEHLKSRVMGQVRSDALLFEAAREPESPRRARGWLARVRAARPAWAIGATAAVAAAAVVVTLALGGGTDRETVYAARVDGVVAPQGRASLAVHDGEARLRVSSLPAAGTGRMYEVWMSDASGRPQPSGVRFSVDAQGAGEVAMPTVPAAGREIMVTSERGGDAPAPTRAPILRLTT